MHFRFEVGTASRKGSTKRTAGGGLIQKFLKGRKRQYEFASTGRLASDLNVFDLGPDGAISNLGTMRTRARYMRGNNPWLKKFLLLQRINIIGSRGIVLQARSKDADGTYDKFANDLHERRWAEWGRKENASLDREFSLRSIDCENIENYFCDGEVLLLKVRGANNPFKFALQVLDPALLDEALNAEATDDHGRIRLGIELDDNNVKTHYWLRQRHDSVLGANSSTHIRVPADRIIHWYKRERPNQIRGVTWFATPGLRSQMLDKIEEAVLVGTRAAACKMAFITPNEHYEGDEWEVSQDDVPMDTSPGQIDLLPHGVDLHEFNPDYPNANMPDFTKNILRGIACGLGVSYNALTSDLENANYSSLRQGSQDDRDAYREFQQTYIEQVRSDYHREWLMMAILVRQFDLPFAKLDKWMMVRHLPRGWKHIDPLKGERGNEIALLSTKTTSRSRICADAGEDFEEILEELEREKKLLEDAGIPEPEYQMMDAQNTDTLINQDSD